jgi:6-phosphogluconolactonase
MNTKLQTDLARGAVFIVLITFGMISTAMNSDQQSPDRDLIFYVGTYTANESKGIYKYHIDASGRLKKVGLSAATENPSFLAKSSNGKYLLAANENSDDNGSGGSVSSFAIEKDTLRFIDKKPSGGDSPCFLAINSTGHVLAANYSSGNVGVLKLSGSGSMEGPSQVLQHAGQGTHARQKEPHAHSAWFVKNDEAITVDLGTNELWFWQLDRATNKFRSGDPQRLAMAAGAGPRHMSFHPNGKTAYVINELNSTITIVRKNKSGKFEAKGSVTTLPTGFKGENFCADIHTSPDGKFLYASNRGHNSIAIFQIAKSGELIAAGHESVRGDWPRNFALTPDGSYLLVANQRSNNIVSFKRDRKTGRLGYVNEIAAPSPVFVLF